MANKKVPWEPGGAPKEQVTKLVAKFPTSDELREAVEDYFTFQKTQRLPYTNSGLARRLGISKQQFWVYVNDKRNLPDEYMEILLDAYWRIEERLEECMSGAHNARSPSGPQFVLQHMGWKDEKMLKLDAEVSTLVHTPKDLAEMPTEDLEKLRDLLTRFPGLSGDCD